ncbi:MAG: hypothetical protein C0596_09995 [Marinilabiliales bacterium]|nr:MAG: hypothetical protein C0596_09995 [Marinilabiliales bacterium]
MKSKNVIFLLAVSAIFILGLSAYKLAKDPWKVPDTYKNKTNPVKSSSESLEYGQELYDMSCASCHGASGKGDGVKGKKMGIEMYDFTDANFHSKFTDGEIYYQSFIGRYRWHDFRSVIQDEEDRWNVVNYVRSMKK